MILRYLTRKLFLDIERRLDDRRDEPRCNVPLDVAVKQPHARVIGAKAQHDVAVGIHEDGVAAHGSGGESFGFGRVVETCVVFAAVDDLEGVAVEMEGVLSGVVVVEDDLDDLIVAEDELVCV